jgi:hypothetical protein
MERSWSATVHLSSALKAAACYLFESSEIAAPIATEDARCPIVTAGDDPIAVQAE